jgi:transcriptional regulator with XRE-family HTH domain
MGTQGAMPPEVSDELIDQRIDEYLALLAEAIHSNVDVPKDKLDVYAEGYKEFYGNDDVWNREKRLLVHAIAIHKDLDFGAWLRLQMKYRKWNQSEMARRAGVSASVVSKWIRGKIVPRPEQCARIARAMKMSPDTVLTMAGHRPREDESPPELGDTESDPLVKAVQSMANHIPRAKLQVVAQMMRPLVEAPAEYEAIDAWLATIHESW